MARPRQVSDEEILDAARACFLEHGPSVSTAHIAGECGLSQAALFKRFHTKENLLLAAMAPPAEPGWTTALAVGPDERPVPDQLVDVGVQALAFMRELVPRMMVLKASGIDPQTLLARFDVPPPIRAFQVLSGFLQALCDEGRMRCDDPRTLALQFMGGLHVRAYMGHMFEAHLGLGDDPTYVRRLVDSLWNGLDPAEDP